VKESKILKLKTPIMRDDKPVHEITLLRRITSPALPPAEANKLGLRDFARAMILVAEMFALDDEDGEVVGKPSPAA